MSLDMELTPRQLAQGWMEVRWEVDLEVELTPLDN